MNFQTSKQQLLDSSRKMSQNWKKTKEIWQDQKSEQFYKTYIENLERQLQASLQSIDEIDELFKEVEKDCF